MKKILILTAYDYSKAFEKLPENCEIYCICPKKDKNFDNDVKNKLEEIFKNKYYEIKYKTNELEILIKQIKPDVLLTLGWRRIIKKEILDLVPQCINVHPAILPEYKGYHPVPYVLINNEMEHGITAHIINERMDDGYIVLIKKFPISKFSTLKSLQQKVSLVFPDFLLELFEKIKNDEIQLIENDSSKTKIIAPKRKPEDSEIDSSKTLDELYDYIRACDEERFPAFFYVNGEKVYIHLSRGDVERNCKYDI